MSTIWWFAPFLSDEPGLDRLGRHCRFTKGEEVMCASAGAHESPSGNSPTARLDLSLENFSLDCFYWVDCLSLRPYMFVSQDLRNAMALGSRDVQYVPVDASRSAPVPRSKNYMIMHVPAVENISAPDRSIYHGTAGTPERPILVGRIAIRHDADPKHDIFRDSFFPGFVFCTDELAVRVLQRQCSGIRFVDPWCIHEPLRFRSLGGIEEESRDAGREPSHCVSGGTEADRGADANNTHAGANGIYASYGDHIRGVQFAAVQIPMGPLATAKVNPANLVRLADESLRSGAGETITSAQLLDALDQSGERDAVWSAIAKFQLNPKQAADILAARAYVWANNFAPSNFADVPAGGPQLESVSKSIMLVELARPGTLYLALQGDRLSTAYIRMAAEEGLSDEGNSAAG